MSRGDSGEQRRRGILSISLPPPVETVPLEKAAEYAHEWGQCPLCGSQCGQEGADRAAARLVALREQLAAAERELREAKLPTAEHIQEIYATARERERAEVAVGRLEKAQAALRDIISYPRWLSIGGIDTDVEFRCSRQTYEQIRDLLE